MVAFAEALFEETNGIVRVSSAHFEGLWSEALKINSYR
jgi:hypothetical protein